MSRMARAIPRAILLFQAHGKPGTRKARECGTFRWVASQWSDRTDQRLDLVAAGASGNRSSAHLSSSALALRTRNLHAPASVEVRTGLAFGAASGNPALGPGPAACLPASRMATASEAADGQSADRSGSLQLSLLFLKASPAGGRRRPPSSAGEPTWAGGRQKAIWVASVVLRRKGCHAGPPTHEHCPSPRGGRAARRRGDPRYSPGGGAARPPGRWALRRAVERTGQPGQPVGGWWGTHSRWRRSGASHPTRPGSRAARCSCGNARMDPGCGSAPSSPRPRWSGTAACQAFGMGQIARPAIWMTPPTRRSSRMGALCFGNLGLLYGCSGVLTAPSTVAPSFKGLPTRPAVIADGPHPPAELLTTAARPEQGSSSAAVPDVP
jgi:hypothetical protein